MTTQPSTLLVAGFVFLPLLVVALFVFGCARVLRKRSAVLRVIAGVVAWLLLTAAVAQSGALRRFDQVPPPFMLLALALFALAIGIGFSKLGTQLAQDLPLWALVGFQVFRCPLELLMHRAYMEGVMPVQMSYSGYNFDIVTGITAGVLGVWLFCGRAPKWIVFAWNLLGSALLLVIIAIAILSTPVFRAFGDNQLNVFVTYLPFVWLPAVLVCAALLGHLLLWRRLAAK